MSAATRTATALRGTKRSSASRSAARGVTSTTVRWDRLVRWALIAGVALMVVLYSASLIGLLSASSEGSDTGSQLRELQRQNASLQAQRKSLQGAGGVAIQARKLGMVLPGEMPVVVTGLPGDRR